jgi:hypothetical protein
LVIGSSAAFLSEFISRFSATRRAMLFALYTV